MIDMIIPAGLERVLRYPTPAERLRYPLCLGVQVCAECGRDQWRADWRLDDEYEPTTYELLVRIPGCQCTSYRNDLTWGRQ